MLTCLQKHKAEVRAAQLAKSKDTKEKHTAAVAKKVARVQEALEAVRLHLDSSIQNIRNMYRAIET